MSQKLNTPKGTRDHLPMDVRKREYIFNAISKAFESYGYQPIETPSFELSSTLMGKYGEEGDRLIFRILNSGDKLKKADVEALNNGQLAKFAHSLSEKALRYDLTVPFARFVVQHQNEISFPFKRYQIQPVWRADRPQHGRYQEFYQCDGDVVGSDSLRNEVELIRIIQQVFRFLKLPGFTVKLNNRKVLSGIAQVCGVQDELISLTVALDKLDKIGKEGVVNELVSKGFNEEVLKKIEPLFELQGTFNERLLQLRDFLSGNEMGLLGLEELSFVHSKLKDFIPGKEVLELDVTLARGLNYYTGIIIEVKAHEVEMGSICGGGRYDDLTALFGLKGLSGVGISFGADRIYDVLNSLDLFPSQLSMGPDILFLNFSDTTADVSDGWAAELRSHGKTVEVYPSNAKLQKQMKYANDRGAQWTAFYGDEEAANQSIVLKNMTSGEQKTYNVATWISDWLG